MCAGSCPTTGRRPYRGAEPPLAGLAYRLQGETMFGVILALHGLHPLLRGGEFDVA